MGIGAETARADERQFANPMRAFVSQKARHPAAHELSDNMGLPDTESVLEFPNEIDEIGERILLAELLARSPADEVGGVYQFLGRPDELVSTTFHRSEEAALEAQLSAAIARIQEGAFVPTPSEFICSSCPALDVICAGPRLRQHHESALPAEVAVG